MNIHQLQPLRWRLTSQGTIVVALLLLLLCLHFTPQDAPEWPRLDNLQGHDVYWELPHPTPPKGLLLFAHGCNHAGGDMWAPSPSCSACKGLPVERRIRELALRRGLAVVAVSSAQATSLGAGCWDSAPGPGTDLALMPLILEALTGREPALHGLPVYALGASSGGGFALLLPKTMKLDGIIAQIMAAPASLLQDSRFPYPPTVFLHMPRDKRIAGAVAEDVATLEKMKVKVAEGKSGPRAVTAAFLVQSSGGAISGRLAAKIVAALQEGGFLDGEGMLRKDPRRHHAEWAAAVAPVVADAVSLEPDASPLTELLNVAWASHEIIYTGVEAALAWLEAGGEGDFDAALAAEEAAERRAAGRRRRLLFAT